MYNVNNLWYVYVSRGWEKNMGWSNDMLGAGKKGWLTLAMHSIDKYVLRLEWAALAQSSLTPQIVNDHGMTCVLDRGEYLCPMIH